MIKKISDLSDLININQEKNIRDSLISDLLNIINKETGLILKNDNIFFIKNIIKIKVNSNLKFKIYLHMNNIEGNFKKINTEYSIEF